MLDSLGFTHVTLSQSTEHGVEFVKLDLIDLQLAQKVARKGVELLGRFYQREIGVFYLIMPAGIIRWLRVQDRAAFSPEIHEAALVSFQDPFGRVRSADEVIALIEQGIDASQG